MAAPIYSADDLLTALQALLPTGPAWPRAGEAVQTQVLATLVEPLREMTDRAASLLSDAFPIAPVELLPEWEATLGLPDPCVGAAPTLLQRQQQVHARFVASGGQSVPYFTMTAANLGYPVTITEFAPSRFGRPFGLPFGGEAWAHAWQVDAPTFTVEPFLFGRNAFGDPFAVWDNTVLQCEMKRLSPAHTMLLFAYS